jgi:hypothetical protein
MSTKNKNTERIMRLLKETPHPCIKWTQISKREPNNSKQYFHSHSNSRRSRLYHTLIAEKNPFRSRILGTIQALSPVHRNTKDLRRLRNLSCKCQRNRGSRLSSSTKYIIRSFSRSKRLIRSPIGGILMRSVEAVPMKDRPLRTRRMYSQA